MVEARWEALRRTALGLDATGGHKLSALGRECEHLAIIAAWFQADGNITHAAARVGSNRKTLRDHIVSWRADHPQLVPPPPDDAVVPRKRKPKPKRKPKRKAQRPASDGTEHALPSTLPPAAGEPPP